MLTVDVWANAADEAASPSAVPARSRMTDMRKMHPDLVRTSRLENKAKKRNVAGGALSRKGLQHLIMRRRRTPRLPTHDGDFRSIGSAAAETRINRPFRARQLAPHEREIAAEQPAVAAVAFELLCQPLVRGIVFRNDQQARRVFVEAVHDTRPLDPPDTGQAIAAMRDQRVDQRS